MSQMWSFWPECLSELKRLCTYRLQGAWTDRIAEYFRVTAELFSCTLQGPPKVQVLWTQTPEKDEPAGSPAGVGGRDTCGYSWLCASVDSTFPCCLYPGASWSWANPSISWSLRVLMCRMQTIPASQNTERLNGVCEVHGTGLAEQMSQVAHPISSVYSRISVSLRRLLPPKM